MFVIPREGVLVRDPATRMAVPIEGMEVPPISYWFRRLRDGDLTEGKAPTVTRKTKPEASE